MISNEKKLISVIVPVYKVECYLDRCVQSIIGQTYANLEIILIDDGSPDNCPIMCDVWKNRDSRIRVIHKNNGGLSDARNAGVVAAAGEYIAFVDSDDWIAPQMLERLYDAIQRDSSDIAACAVEMVWDDGTQSRMFTVQTNCVLEKKEAQHALLKETLLKQPVWYKLYRREIIRGILFEVGRYHEDVFWSYQVMGNAKCVSLIDYKGYFYNQRCGSIMGEEYSYKRLDAIEAFERRYRYIAKYFPSLECEARLSILEGCIYHGQMVLKHLRGKDRKQAMCYLEEVEHKYLIKCGDYAGQKITHWLWLCLSRVSLVGTCMIKNVFRIGL